MDHCHVTGEYRGSDHRITEVVEEHKKYAIFHNLKGYDSHHIVEDIGKLYTKWNRKIHGFYVREELSIY